MPSLNEYDETESAMIRAASSSSMPSSSRNQRSRITPFIWERFTTRPTGEFTSVNVSEKPNTRIVDMIIQNWSDHEKVRENISDLSSIRDDFRRSWMERSVSYSQKDFSSYRDPEYVGAVKIGRSYSFSQFPRLERTLFNTIYKRSHIELDLKASFPTMLVTAFRDLEIPALEAYASNPDKLFSTLRTDCGLTKNQVKTAVVSMICSHPKYAYDYGLGFSDDAMDGVRAILDDRFFGQLKEDLTKIGECMTERYGPFVRTISEYRRQSSPNKDSRRDLGAAISWLAMDMEHSCMRTILEIVGTDNIVWKSDAVVIPMTIVRSPTIKSFTDRLEQLVEDRHGIKISVEVKDMHEESLGICLPEQEIDETRGYLGWKRGFESKFFKLFKPPVYCMIDADGTVTDLLQKDFNHVTKEEPKEYKEQWESDTNKRMYFCKDYAPPPLQQKPNSFNTFIGIAAAKLPPNTLTRDISPYLTHVNLLMGKEQTSTEYIHDCLAYKIQNPGLKLRVMTFVRSTPGVGKDLWADFIIKIFGSSNCVKVTNVSDVVGKGSGNREGKLLTFISEINYEDCKRNDDELKNAITEEEVLVKKKYIQEYFMRSCTDYIGFSNNFNALNLPPDDRRYHVVTACGIHANDAAYFEPLITWMSQEENQRAVYEFYMNRDVSSFNPSASRPVTASFRDMAESSISPVDIFFRKAFPLWIQNGLSGSYDSYGGAIFKLIGDEVTGSVRILNTRFHDDFEALCEENKWQPDGSRRSKEKWLKKMIGEAVSRMARYQTSPDKAIIRDVRSHGTRYVLIDIPGMKRYLTEMISEDVDCEEIDDNGEVENGDGQYARGFTPGRNN